MNYAETTDCRPQGLPLRRGGFLGRVKSEWQQVDSQGG